MRILFTLVLTLCSLTFHAAESLIFSAQNAKENQKLCDLKTPTGRWLKSQYPCRVKGGITTNWKGHASFFHYASAAGTWKLKFNVKISANAANEIIIAQRSGNERQVGMI